MTPRSLSRWLAPLALLASLLAVLFVVSGSRTDEEGDGAAQPTTQERREARGETGTSTTSTGARTSTTRQRRTYTVRPGDTLASISERTGVSVEELQELNPDVDPNNLTVGQRIRLTE